MDIKLTTIYLVRHGESQGNFAFQNDLPTPDAGEFQTPLTENGRNQAKTLADKLNPIHIDGFFSSDLTRAKQTAEIIAAERKLEVITAKLIRERVNGETWESKSTKERKLLQEEMQRILEKLDKDAQLRYKQFEDMESGEQAVSRLITFLREIAVAYHGKTVLVVAHGALMRYLLAHLGFATVANLPSGSIKNTAYIKLESDGVDFFIRETHQITKRA